MSTPTPDQLLLTDADITTPGRPLYEALAGKAATSEGGGGGGGSVPVMHPLFTSDSALRPLTSDSGGGGTPEPGYVHVLLCAAPYARRARRLKVAVTTASSVSTLVEFGIYDGETLNLIGTFGTIDLATEGQKILDRGSGNQIIIPPLAFLATRLRASSSNGGALRKGMEQSAPHKWVGNSWDNIAEPSTSRGEAIALAGTGALPESLAGGSIFFSSTFSGPYANFIAN